MKYKSSLFCIAALASAMYAQESRKTTFHPFVTGSIDVLNNLGYTNPNYYVGGGAEVDSPRFLFETRIEGGITHKLETKDGKSLAFENTAFSKVGHWMFGGGSRYGYTQTSQWSKSSSRPFFATGYDAETFRVTGRYKLPMFDKQNGLNGPQVRVELKANHHFSVEILAGVYRFHDTRVPGVDYGGVPAEHHFGCETGLGLKYAF